MAGQQQQIIDTIFNMKRKILRRDDSADTDEADPPFSSQKQDLKRKVHYARASDPDFLLDPRPYKKRIEHAGYQRAILQRNPPRFDPDGDLVEPDDEYEEEEDLEAVEENPYGNIQLENAVDLLAPLTSAADLPSHLALSVAYTSNHLTDLANEAGALSRKEQITIARAKNLFVKLQGDSSFVPAALAAMGHGPFHDPWSNGSAGRAVNGELQQDQDAEMLDTTESAHDTMEGAGQAHGAPHRNGTNSSMQPEAVNGEAPVTNGTSHDVDVDKPRENGEEPLSPAADDASDTASQQTAHRMTTRARAQAASTPSPPQSPSGGDNAIHPLFTFSTESLPDRDVGLPPNEAEETRMLLLAYVQKQEEVARITADLYQGLLQADRMRQDVFKWSKAEAHLGEMSDGEDWYDNEEWGLDQDLIKGRDEEEDETAAAGKKSTRQRRKPDKDDRTCPACSASLHNPDDVVIAGLNPAEDYKTSVLSGLSPTVIMECASRALSFHSYQTSQEIIYQEHLAKGLTEKYNTLNQQMDQLIHDANAQIKALQDKMQGPLILYYAEQTSLEAKNHELVDAFKEKTRSQQQTQKLYQSLKAQVMASHVANAAGDEAEFTLQSVRGDRFIDRLPGTRTSTGNFGQAGVGQQTSSGRPHNRDNSRSSRSGGQQIGGIRIGPTYTSHLQGRDSGSRVFTGRKPSLYFAASGFGLDNQPPLGHRPNPTEVVSQSLAERVKIRTSIRMPALRIKRHR
ncbi:Nn.00g018940.m01.CDS01 [Neocucurbitaria sp. VM-36]